MTELELLQRMRKDHAFYMGEKSLTALLHFCNGYRQYSADCGEEIPDSITKAMHKFSREWYDISGHFPLQRLLLMVKRSENAAFDAFFELLDRYLEGYDPHTQELKHDYDENGADTEGHRK